VETFSLRCRQKHPCHAKQMYFGLCDGRTTLRGPADLRGVELLCGSLWFSTAIRGPQLRQWMWIRSLPQGFRILSLARLK